VLCAYIAHHKTAAAQEMLLANPRKAKEVAVVARLLPAPVRATGQLAARLAALQPALTACAKSAASGYSVAPPGDVGDTLRTDMLGVDFAGGDGATVSNTERFSLPATVQCDLAADHHDARIPIM